MSGKYRVESQKITVGVKVGEIEKIAAVYVGDNSENSHRYAIFTP